MPILSQTTINLKKQDKLKQTSARLGLSSDAPAALQPPGSAETEILNDVGFFPRNLEFSLQCQWMQRQSLPVAAVLRNLFVLKDQGQNCSENANPIACKEW